MWIDRVLTQSDSGPDETELHERLTVVASSDTGRRRAVFNRVLLALAASPGSTMEVRTEFGDHITAERGVSGAVSLFDTNNKLPIRPEERSLGIIGQLNDRETMTSYLELFHASPQSLRIRAQESEDLVRLARTPLNQLFSLASQITSGEAALDQTQSRRSDLTESIRRRETREQSLSEKIDERSEDRRRVDAMTIGSLAMVVGGVYLALSGQPSIGALLCLGALGLAAFGHRQTKLSGLDHDIEGEALDIQLGRVGELFDTHDLSRSRRKAEETLAASRAEWRSIAGNTKPAALLKDRPQIEELARHLQIIENEAVAPGDTSLLVGFAALLAEISRRFPSERVPLLVEDLFSDIAPQYHGVMCELLLRASHRRQVVLETSDLAVAKWAAVEAVGGDAMLVSDFDIDVEQFIAEAVASTETDGSV